jgi:hypothetical protein
MIKIFFFSPTGFIPMKNAILKSLIDGSHGWQADGESWVYGICIPRQGVDPNEVADVLESLGVHVLPGVHDQDTNPHPNVHKALARHGVVPGDKTSAITKKMHNACGMPILKPHFF